MKHKSRIFQRIFGFTFQWTLLTLIGFLSSLFLIEIGEKPDIGIISAIFGGFAIAIPQSFIIRQTIPPLNWILSTIFALVIITLTGIGTVGWFVILNNFLPMRILIGIISGAIGGLIIGISQWLLAIPPSLPTGWQWIFINCTAWMLSIPIGTSVGLCLHRLTNLFLSEILGLLITWILVAIITGIGVKKILTTAQ